MPIERSHKSPVPNHVHYLAHSGATMTTYRSNIGVQFD